MSRNQVWNQVGYKSNKNFSFSKQESTFHSLSYCLSVGHIHTQRWARCLQKLTSAELTEQVVIATEFRLFRRTEIFQNSASNPSAEGKTTRNSVPRNRNRSKVFLSDPFSGRENNSEFRSAEQKYK
jgi:hypothetical protein